METLSTERIVIPAPFRKKPFAASRTLESLESKDRDCIERHPAKRRDVCQYLRMKEAYGQDSKEKHERHITQECEQE